MSKFFELKQPKEEIKRRRSTQRNIIPGGVTNRLLTRSVTGSQLFKIDTIGGWVNIGVDQPKTNQDPQTILYITGEIDGYYAVNLQNMSKGEYASTDFVVFNDTLTNFEGDISLIPDSGYIDIGVSGSGNTDADYALFGASAEYVWAADDLYIGTSGTDKNVYFFSGGLDSKDYITCSINSEGVLFPVQAEGASPPTYVEGGIYFNTTSHKLMVGGAAGWETVTSA